MVEMTIISAWLLAARAAIASKCCVVKDGIALVTDRQPVIVT